MSLNIPLTVRLKTVRGDRHVTSEVRDLVTRWTDPGGHASCQIALDRPLSLQPDEIDFYSDLYVYDARNGRVVFDGRLQDQGRGASAGGQVWQLAALGGQAHTNDRTVPLIYIDSEPVYERVDNGTPGATAAVGASPGDAAGADQHLVLQFPQGLGITTNSRVVMRYNKIWRAGQKIARISFSWDAGVTDLNHAIQAVTRDDGDLVTGENATSATLSTAGGTESAVIDTDFATTRTTVELRQIRTAGGATTMATDTYWVAVANEIFQATMYNALGFEKTDAIDYLTDYVLASDVVRDLLGRLLNAYDGENATITSTTHQITQLAYPDGVTPGKVLSDLLTLEAGFTWRVWERNAAGKFRFEWVANPATVRYDADVTDGYDAPGSADGIFNAVTVRWRDSGGHIRTTTRTATVDILDAAGLTRQALIDLGDEVGSTADAQRAGDQWLLDHAHAPNAGRLRIARNIMDLQTGMMVAPWEIGPGLIRVRGILPRVDALNATARDGTTVFRIRACEYRASDAAATLELDSYAPSTARALADLQARPVHRRR
jgi:hypothetical protein